jgi:hypothetical protein
MDQPTASSRQPKPANPPAEPPRLILGSSLIKLMPGLKSTRIQAIPGAHFCHLDRWAQCDEGRFVLRNKIKVIILCGGNSLADGVLPDSVFSNALTSINIIKSLTPDHCAIYLSTLPPRPQIDIYSDNRFIFNKILISSHQNDGLLVTDAEQGLLDPTSNLPKLSMLKTEEFSSNPKRDIVHLSPAGLVQLRRNYSRTLGRTRHGRTTPPFVIKKNEIGLTYSYHP